MRHDDRVCLPPLHVLEALRQPRRAQLGDPQVRELFGRWKCLGRPITFNELFRELVDLLVPAGEAICVDQITTIRQAVLSAGIEIHDDRPLYLYQPVMNGGVIAHPIAEYFVDWINDSPRLTDAERSEIRRKMGEALEARSHALQRSGVARTLHH